MKLYAYLLLVPVGLLVLRRIRNAWRQRGTDGSYGDSSGDGSWLDFLPSFGGSEGDSGDSGGGDGGGGDGGGD